MAIMKILVDSNLVFNYVLGRSHQNSPSLQPFAYSRRTITTVGKIIAEMNRRD